MLGEVPIDALLRSFEQVSIGLEYRKRIVRKVRFISVRWYRTVIA